MTIKDIDKYFEHRILRRGYEYFKHNHICAVKETNGIFKAIVEGTDLYHVIIDTTTKEIDMTCDCPCETNCKHMAAVLYYIKKDGKIEKRTEDDLDNIEIKNSRDLNRCLNNALRNLKTTNYYDSITIKDLIKILDQIFAIIDKEPSTEKYYDYCINIQYWIDEHISDFFATPSFDSEELEEELENFDEDNNIYEKQKTPKLSKDSKPELINTEELYDIIATKIMRCINESTTYLRSYLSYLDGKYEDSYYNEFYELSHLASKITNKEIANSMLAFLDFLVKNIENYEKDKIQRIIISLKSRFHETEQVVIYARKHLSQPSIQEYLLNYYKEHDYQRYIILLEKLLTMDIRNNLREKYLRLLLEIYKAENQKDNYSRIIKMQYKMFPNKENFLLVKQEYSESEWIQVRNEYITPYKRQFNLYIDLCFEEKLYNQIFDVLENKDVTYIENYLDKLKDADLQKTYNLFKEKIIESTAKSFSSRKEYERIIKSIIKLYKLTNDNQDMEELILYFNEKYKSRKAFLEELDFFKDTYLD